jgi:hypothetical protein
MLWMLWIGIELAVEVDERSRPVWFALMSL